MISGLVNANREAVVGIVLRGSGGQQYRVDAVIDTGFNRFVTVPSVLIAALELEQACSERAELGDGSVALVDVFNALVLWDGAWRLVTVHASDTSPLVGMELLAGYELRIQVVAGGAVTVEAMPKP